MSLPYQPDFGIAAHIAPRFSLWKTSEKLKKIFEIPARLMHVPQSPAGAGFCIIGLGLRLDISFRISLLLRAKGSLKMSTKKNNQARLRLVVDNECFGTTSSVGHFEECNAASSSAASPRGEELRPQAISLRVDMASPVAFPMSESVNPAPCKSRMRDFQVGIGPRLREPVTDCQRKSVTETRENGRMARPNGLPRFVHLGDRVKWWREHRKLTREQLAEKAGIAYSTLASLENNETKSNRKSHLIAAALGLNAHYLDSDKGEPEAGVPQDPPPRALNWPLQNVSLKDFEGLNRVERVFVEARIQDALKEVAEERRQGRKAS